MAEMDRRKRFTQAEIDAMAADRPVLPIDTVAVIAHTPDGRAVLRLAGPRGDAFISVPAEALAGVLTDLIIDFAGLFGAEITAAVQAAKQP